MAFRLGEYVIRGELFNIRNYATHGRLQLRDSEQLVAIELTGNCSDDLRGKHICFEVNRNDNDSNEDKPDYSGLAWIQVGVTGTMTADHWVKIPDCPIDEYIERCERGEQPSVQRKRCLYLEWYSQNGRVVLELPDAIITIVDDDENEKVLSNDSLLPTEIEELEDIVTPALGITSMSIGDAGATSIDEFVVPCDDPARESDAAFSDSTHDELQHHLDAESRKIDLAIGDDEDSEFMREMVLMDDLIEHGTGEQIRTLFGEPERLPGPDGLTDNEAEQILKSLLSLLAMHGVALHVCEHFTPRETYRLLIDVIAKEESFHPQLRGTQWVQNFMTSEHCKECDEEFERRMEAESFGEDGE